MEEILDVQMPPASETAEPQPETLTITKEYSEEEVSDIKERLDEEPKEMPRQLVPDEEVFKEVPQVKKVKRQPSAKQLAHLQKMREKKEAKRREKEEWLDEQKSKQKKFVEAEEQKVGRGARANTKNIDRKIKINNQPTFSEIPPAQGGQQSGPVNYEEDYYEEPVPAVSQQQQVGMYQLSAEQIRDLQFNAIADYDTIRKQQKAEKQQQQAKQYLEQKKKQVFNQMRSSAQPQYDANDPWASCFN